MSDATSLCSSESPASADGNTSSSSAGNGDTDTSLIAAEGLSAREEGSGEAEGDGKADSKQKRKRTSPKDQATLEAEYKLNPKPNKAARADIVEKVDLNEKEVQIWFQNRRQIQRRKSRPLLPHEIAAFGIAGLAALSSDPASAPNFSSNQGMGELLMSSQEEESVNTQENQVMNSQESLHVSEPLHVETSDEVENMPSSISSIPHPTPTFKKELSGDSGIGASSFSNSSVFKSFSSTPGYLANRWNATRSSFSTPTSSQAAQFMTSTIPTHPSSCPEKLGVSGSSTTPSQVRLSMSLNGKAELISSEPSPQRVQAPRPSSSESAIPQARIGGLQRSQSALSFGPFRGAFTKSPLIPRLPRGRSRDARSWQFAADAEARDELTTQAENESNGSAVAAISLIRSTSNSALKPNSNKRNTSAAKNVATGVGKKPKLGRAQSSLARLQSTGLEPRPQSSKGKDGLIHSPSGDSDKENWLPADGGNNARRRPLPSGRSDKQFASKPVLGDNFNPPTNTANIGGNRNKRRKMDNAAPKIFEDQENSGEVPKEIENFMRSEVSPSKRGEVEGAKALLAMMGAWR